MVTVLVRGGGDLATGTALRLHRAGLGVVIAEAGAAARRQAAGVVLRGRLRGLVTVEGVRAERAASTDEARAMAARGIVPVLVAPDRESFQAVRADVLVDARLTKQEPDIEPGSAPLVIGLGPGFAVGRHCHAVVETQRGHTLGRVYWSGQALPDTGTPEGDPRRVLRAPVDGPLRAHVEIGQQVRPARRSPRSPRRASNEPLAGVVRGLIRPASPSARE